MTENVLILDDADRLMNLEETAKRMRTGRKFVKGLIDAGLLGAIRFGNECRVPKSCLHAFFVEHMGEDLLKTLASATIDD
mgnify:FL=1